MGGFCARVAEKGAIWTPGVFARQTCFSKVGVAHPRHAWAGDTVVSERGRCAEAGAVLSERSRGVSTARLPGTEPASGSPKPALILL